MSEQGKPYTILEDVHQPQWDSALNKSVVGTDVTVRWEPTGSVFHVFVPDGKDLAAGVDTLARFEGAKRDALYGKA